MRRNYLAVPMMLAVSLSAGAADRKATPTIIDLTDTIHVGIVEESIGDAAMKALGIDEVAMTPEMTFTKTTGRSTRLCLSSQIGTHMDAGAHADPDGWPINAAPLDHLIVPGVVVDVRNKTDEQGITSADLGKYDIRPGDAVLFLFSYAKPKPGEMFTQSFLTEEVAEWLVKRGVRCVGSNTPGLEDHKRGTREHWMDPANQKQAWPVHKILLRHQIPIIEGLTNLDKLVGKRFQFIGLPLKIDGIDGAPVRALAVLE
jgi:kynurenine formamidase